MTTSAPVHILVVEDNEDLQYLLVDCIESEEPSAKVFKATEGSHALVILGEEHIDLILSDVMMPNMDGARLTRTLCADEKLKHIPVLLLTALDEGRIGELLALPNVKGYLRKPLNPKDVAEHILPFARSGPPRATPKQL